MKPLILPLLLPLLAACAAGPRFETGGIDTALTPREAASGSPVGERVLWGGLIVAGENREGASVLEVLGYPLDERQRPDTGPSTVGRFLVREAGYLELADYTPGKLVTLVGELTGVETGRVGEADYRFPVVRAERLHLWPGETEPGEPRFHFGFGVILSR